MKVPKLFVVLSAALLLVLRQTQAQSVTPSLKAHKPEQPQQVEPSQEAGIPDAQAQGQPRGELPKAVIGYAAHLRELAQEAQVMEGRLPQTPQEGITNLWRFKAILTQTRILLLDILRRKEQIASEKDRVLESASQVQQSFLNLAKKIGTDAQELQRNTNGQPAALQSVIKGHHAAKAVAEKGAALVATLRDEVVKDSLDVESTLSELAEYRTLFDNLIEVCRLYIAGLGDLSDYNQMVQALAQARESLRQVVQSFAQAALNAEKAAQRVPPQVPALSRGRPD